MTDRRQLVLTLSSASSLFSAEMLSMRATSAPSAASLRALHVVNSRQIDALLINTSAVAIPEPP